MWAFEQHIDEFFADDGDALKPEASTLALQRAVSEKVFEQGLENIAKAVNFNLQDQLSDIERQILGLKTKQQECLRILSVNTDPPLSEDKEYVKVSRIMAKLPAYIEKLRMIRQHGKHINTEVQTLKRRVAQMAKDYRGVDPFQEIGEFFYQVTHPGGVLVRSEPSLAAAPTGTLLPQHTILKVLERVRIIGDDTVYLRIAEGQGWVFEAKKDRVALSRITARMAADRGGMPLAHDVRRDIIYSSTNSSRRNSSGGALHGGEEESSSSKHSNDNLHTLNF
uniref:Uncharacterized protein n=1 Tax=Heterosigma akashiwo TaxID=2829 RepID=A0A7S4D8H9_HETAK|mmetsp:Transcript_19321/g.31542  ORF Transcript_19321/g.31542 Transcript_19321/m.31542 type:complete len:280 (-) Transcript_19321:193-1032(-)